MKLTLSLGLGLSLSLTPTPTPILTLPPAPSLSLSLSLTRCAELEYEKEQHKLRARSLQRKLEQMGGGLMQTAQNATQLEVQAAALTPTPAPNLDFKPSPCPNPLTPTLTLTRCATLRRAPRWRCSPSRTSSCRRTSVRWSTSSYSWPRPEPRCRRPTLTISTLLSRFLILTINLLTNCRRLSTPASALPPSRARASAAFLTDKGLEYFSGLVLSRG
jgi:hypothetical protein